MRAATCDCRGEAEKLELLSSPFLKGRGERENASHLRKQARWNENLFRVLRRKRSRESEKINR